MKWQKKAYKVYFLRLKREEDKDLIDFLKSKPSVNAYLKELIRKDFKR